jgi:5-methylcytosine-specific restriction protein A
VHHQAVSIAEMSDVQITRLDDLICLCANCHRVTHHELRLQSSEGCQ